MRFVLFRLEVFDLSSYTKACVMMCKRPAFWRFLVEEYRRLVESEDEALKVVRMVVGIESRRELVRGSAAGEEWASLVWRFNQWLKHARND